MRKQLSILVLGLALAGCREGASPYEAPDREPPTGDTYRLTWGAGLDRNPQWSPDGDSIYYHTTYWRELDANGGGLLMRIPFQGGVAEQLAPDAQPRGILRLADPVVSRDGSRLAFVQFVRMNAPAPCLDGFEEPQFVVWVCGAPEPRLDSAVIRVRDVDSTEPITSDPGVGVKYLGPDPRRTATLWPPPYYQRVYPFQDAWARRDDASPLRPALSADGTRVIFSDGLQLLSWRVGESAATPIPNTQDGVAPAWSPDGQWIAFTVNERVDSAQYQCSCMEGNEGSRHWRWGYTVRQRIAVIRPDGTTLRLLADGHEPAWAPGSDRIYYSYDGSVREIRAVALNGGAPVTVAGTEDGRMPAVSPDGKLLAFSRRKSYFEDFDLWVTRLQD